ncbi:Wzz/FepE/Etk N-terminal domain-containing protein [Nonomuraea roseoviolacea]|uniref:Capsular polysaccharide biosynthesis protein n=1 Tax=Nonomuraea roseoviolacea subsp. carminata TaxID=160689 RepID=A0ABT1K2W7_9ACTN|nr:Wzz/FepE/Etk N-terminal domain-containing protein [Nonomuraea roseoviolacea]MCP2348338.1 capsular polysaccharide biosynthesis protein [Nonomuraea roseoviolacea subsp. carminata]
MSLPPDLPARRSGADLGDHLSLLTRRRLIFAGFVLAGGAAGLGLMRLTPPAYTATTQVLVAAVGVQEQGNQVTNRQREPLNLDTEAQVAASAVVADRAARLLRISTPEPVEVAVPPNSAVLSLSVTAATPDAAAAQSRAYAEAYLANRAATAQAALALQQKAMLAKLKQVNTTLATVTRELETLRKGTAEHILATHRQSVLNRQAYSLTLKYDALKTTTVTPGSVISDAVPPTDPASPSLPLFLGTGLMLGLLLGAGAAMLRDRLDTRLRTPDDVERLTGLPVLASLPRDDRGSGSGGPGVGRGVRSGGAGFAIAGGEGAGPPAMGGPIAGSSATDLSIAGSSVAGHPAAGSSVASGFSVEGAEGVTSPVTDRRGRAWTPYDAGGDGARHAGTSHVGRAGDEPLTDAIRRARGERGPVAGAGHGRSEHLTGAAYGASGEGGRLLISDVAAGTGGEGGRRAGAARGGDRQSGRRAGAWRAGVKGARGDRAGGGQAGAALADALHELAGAAVAACPGKRLLVRAVPTGLATTTVTSSLSAGTLLSVLDGSDTADLARADAALLMVELGRATSTEVLAAVRHLSRHRVPVIGVVTTYGEPASPSLAPASAQAGLGKLVASSRRDPAALGDGGPPTDPDATLLRHPTTTASDTPASHATGSNATGFGGRGTTTPGMTGFGGHGTTASHPGSHGTTAPIPTGFGHPGVTDPGTSETRARHAAEPETGRGTDRGREPDPAQDPWPSRAGARWPRPPGFPS